MRAIWIVVALLWAVQVQAEGGVMPACPDSPNCVSSLSADEDHYVAPIAVPENLTESMIWLRVQQAIQATGGQVVRQDGNRLDATYTSSLFRFVDDVVLILNKEAGVLDIRSASRTGYYDFGANRRRVEAIRKAFLSASGDPV